MWMKKKLSSPRRSTGELSATTTSPIPVQNAALRQPGTGRPPSASVRARRQ